MNKTKRSTKGWKIPALAVLFFVLTSAVVAGTPGTKKITITPQDVGKTFDNIGTVKVGQDTDKIGSVVVRTRDINGVYIYCKPVGGTYVVRVWRFVPEESLFPKAWEVTSVSNNGGKTYSFVAKTEVRSVHGGDKAGSLGGSSDIVIKKGKITCIYVRGINLGTVKLRVDKKL